MPYSKSFSYIIIGPITPENVKTISNYTDLKVHLLFLIKQGSLITKIPHFISLPTKIDAVRIILA
jgi:hypothetical protein